MSKYESHITIEPVLEEERLEQLRYHCRYYGFRVAELLMAKRPNDTPERSKYDTFTTGNSEDLHDITFRCTTLVTVLKAHGFKVWRYKIEETIVDSRDADTWGLLL